MYVRKTAAKWAWWSRLIGLSAVLMATGCGRGEEAPTLAPLPPSSFESTSDPALAMTLQAAAVGTAEWVGRLTPQPTQADDLTATLTPAPVGTLLASRTGHCPQPEGYSLHVREGFCLAAPQGWTPLNVDGGLAASLDTTPGQAIALQPDWATSAAVCSLMIYIVVGDSATEHLEARRAEFEGRADIVYLSPAVEVQNLGTMTLPGFVWERSDGQTGEVLADVVGINRLIHISFSGSQCPSEALLPVLETLRFNIGQ